MIAMGQVTITISPGEWEIIWKALEERAEHDSEARELGYALISRIDAASVNA